MSADQPASTGAKKQRAQRPLRLHPEIDAALAAWAADEMRSTNAQIEMLLRQALRQAGRLPKGC